MTSQIFWQNIAILVNSRVILVYIGRWSYQQLQDDNKIIWKMKNNLTTGTTVPSTTARGGAPGIFPSGQGIFPSDQEKNLDFSLRSIPTVGCYEKQRNLTLSLSTSHKHNIYTP